jgi:hypothetical protein
MSEMTGHGGTFQSGLERFGKFQIVHVLLWVVVMFLGF